MGLRSCTLELRKNHALRFEVVEVIRDGGPRSGQRMGWGVLDLAPDNPAEDARTFLYAELRIAVEEPQPYADQIGLWGCVPTL